MPEATAPDPCTARPGRLLAVDLGQARIGVAVSDELRMTARPLGTIRSVGPRRDARAIRELLGDLRVERLVVGLPLLPSGETGAAAEAALSRGCDLARRLELPVAFVDERDTTVEATAALIEAGRGRRRRRRCVDAAAAAVILERYLHGGGADE